VRNCKIFFFSKDKRRLIGKKKHIACLVYKLLHQSTIIFKKKYNHMTTILIVLVEYTRRKEKHDFGVTFFLNVFWFLF